MKPSAKREARSPEEDARLDKARLRVLEARREFEALTQNAPSSAPAAPAATATATAKPADAKPQSSDDASLEKARLRVEEARREFEAVARTPSARSKTASRQTPTRTRVKATPAARANISDYRDHVFGGYSFLRDRSDGVNFGTGWTAAVARQFNETIDLVGEISGSHKSESLLGVSLASASVYTFAAGPRYIYQMPNFRAFGQVLAGIQNVHGSVLGVSDSSTGFAVLPGGGVDVPITKTLSVRVGADLPVVRNAGEWFSEFRFKTGIVYALPIAR